MSVKISFDDELAVASILLADWAPALVEYLGRYFDVREDMLRLDYAHLSDECIVDEFEWLSGVLSVRQRFVYDLESVAKQGPIAMALTLLGHESTEIMCSSSILDQYAYRSALEDFRSNILQGDLPALRETILADIAPRATWVRRLLDADRDRFLDDREIMTALVASTSEDDCTHGLELVAPRPGQNNWAFEQLVEQHWQHVRHYLETHLGISSGKVPNLVFLLFTISPTVQASRWACEQVLSRANPTVFPRLIQHCSMIEAGDVRSLFLRWHSRPKTEKQDDFRECVAKACSTLATFLTDTMPSDLALAATWHKFVAPAGLAHQRIAESLRELPSGAWDRKALWNQLGPAAREAWRQDLFDQVKGEPELAQGLLYFACLWLEQIAFAEVEPVLLRLLDDEDNLAFTNRISGTGPRQMQLRANGLVRSRQGAPDLEGAVGQGDDATALPCVGAQTWLGDPSVERVIHRALSQIEEKFCCEYSVTWGEDEEAHTARLLALTQEAVGCASYKLRQLSVTTRATYPSLSVKVRQPSKREEGARTPAGAPLGADVLFLTRIVDEGKTVIERATLVQVKKRSGTGSGRGFSSTIGVDLQQCEDMLQQSEHAYYLFATPASPRPTLWVAPARLVRNLTQLHTSKASVVAIQVRDASCSYADFFLHNLVGLWAGDEDEGVVAIASGDPRRGRTPRHIVDIEVRRQSEVGDLH